MAETRQRIQSTEEKNNLLTNTEQIESVHNEDKNGDETKDELAGLPVDRGWAWVILLATIFETFIYGGVMKSYGVFFVQFQARFNSSAAETVLIQTVSNIFVSVSGIFVMTIGMKYMTARTSVVIGTIATTGAYILAAFATRIEVLTFSLGAVAGVAVTLIYLPIVSTIGIYFNKRRGLANSLTVAGASLGTLVFGPLYPIMFEYYGYTGTMLITSGLLLNILITACLLRPPEFYTKRKRTYISEQELKTISKSNEGVCNDNVVGERDKLINVTSLDRKSYPQGNEDDYIKDEIHTKQNGLIQHKMNRITSTSEPLETNKPNGSPSFVKSPPQVSAVTADKEPLKNHTPPSPLLHNSQAETVIHKLDRTNSENNQTDTVHENNIALCSNADIMCGSLASLNFNTAESDDRVIDQIVKDAEHSKWRGCFHIVRTSVVSFLRTVFDMSLLKDPVFIHYSMFASISLPASIITSVYFIPFAKDIGISNQKISVLLFVIGAVDLISRVSVGVFADRKILKPTTILTCAFIIMAVANNFTRLIHSFWTLLIFVLIQGSLSGTYLALYAVVLIEHLGIAKFKSALGFTSMFHGVSVAIFFPITGLLRDNSGAYYWTYHMLSILLIFGAALAFTLPLTHRITRKKSKEVAETTK